jgi:hypothetical protein
VGHCLVPGKHTHTKRGIEKNKKKMKNKKIIDQCYLNRTKKKKKKKIMI